MQSHIYSYTNASEKTLTGILSVTIKFVKSILIERVVVFVKQKKEKVLSICFIDYFDSFSFSLKPRFIFE